MPAAPPKELLEEKDVAPLEEVPQYDIKHVIRGISTVGHFDDHNAYPADVVEDYLRAKYLENGYKLAYVQHLETKIVEGNPIAEMMLYIFLKE
jgi:hypothetical protein